MRSVYQVPCFGNRSKNYNVVRTRCLLLSFSSSLPVRDDLVAVHVGLGPASSLEHHQGKMVVQLSLDHLKKRCAPAKKKRASRKNGFSTLISFKTKQKDTIRCTAIVRPTISHKWCFVQFRSGVIGAIRPKRGGWGGMGKNGEKKKKKKKRNEDYTVGMQQGQCRTHYWRLHNNSYTKNVGASSTAQKSIHPFHHCQHPHGSAEKKKRKNKEDCNRTRGAHQDADPSCSTPRTRWL